jgi:hypothetical protein
MAISFLNRTKIPGIVHIMGGGLSAMVAAATIKARQPRIEVVIYSQPTDMDKVHPSIHVTPFPIAELTVKTGLDFAATPGIKPLDSVEVSINTREKGQEQATVDCRPFGVQLIYRGDRADINSLDHWLYQHAAALGVRFCEDSLSLDNPPTGQLVMATGLTPASYQRLNISAKEINGFFYRRKCAPDERSAQLAFYPELIRTEYFYSGQLNGLEYGLVFDSTAKRNCDLAGYLNSRPDIQEWRPAPTVCVPDLTKPFFYKDLPRTGRVLLAGTISPGMMDPLFYFGITGAVFSGYLVAKAVTEGVPQAEQEFRGITANFQKAAKLRQLLEQLPAETLEQVYGSIAHGKLAGRKTYEIFQLFPFLYQFPLSYFAEAIPGMKRYLSDHLPTI